VYETEPVIAKPTRVWSPSMDRLTQALHQPEWYAPAVGGVPERELLQLEVRCGREAPAIVRAALRQITGLGVAHDHTILVTSELVTNAVVHSGATAADTMQVRVVLIEGAVSISVQDPGLSSDTPHAKDTGVMQPDGRGLRIVGQLARRWGFELDRGHRVWAEIATAPAPT
jgi:anti-sigma regulatory factor (Ser/Thr protein kinase)